MALKQFNDLTPFGVSVMKVLFENRMSTAALARELGIRATVICDAYYMYVCRQFNVINGKRENFNCVNYGDEKTISDTYITLVMIFFLIMMTSRK